MDGCGAILKCPTGFVVGRLLLCPDCYAHEIKAHAVTISALMPDSFAGYHCGDMLPVSCDPKWPAGTKTQPSYYQSQHVLTRFLPKHKKVPVQNALVPERKL